MTDSFRDTTILTSNFTCEWVYKIRAECGKVICAQQSWWKMDCVFLSVKMDRLREIVESKVWRNNPCMMRHIARR